MFEILFLVAQGFSSKGGIALGSGQYRNAVTSGKSRNCDYSPVTLEAKPDGYVPNAEVLLAELFNAGR